MSWLIVIPPTDVTKPLCSLLWKRCFSVITPNCADVASKISAWYFCCSKSFCFPGDAPTPIIPNRDSPTRKPITKPLDISSSLIGYKKYSRTRVLVKLWARFYHQSVMLSTKNRSVLSSWGVIKSRTCRFRTCEFGRGLLSSCRACNASLTSAKLAAENLPTDESLLIQD